MNWGNLFAVRALHGHNFDLSMIYNLKIDNLHSTDIVFDNQILNMFDINNSEEYYIPVNNKNCPIINQVNNYKIFVWQDFALIVRSDTIEEYHWIVSCISAMLGNIEINKENILNFRYANLSHITEYIDEPSDQSEFITTIPRVNYYQKIDSKNLETGKTILNIIIDEDIQDVYDLIFEISRYVAYLKRDPNSDNKKIIYKIIQLSDTYHDKVIKDPREVIIHKLQLLYLINKVYIPADIFSEIIKYADNLKNKADDLGLDNVVWIINLLLKWYFGKGEQLKPKNWEDTSIPNNLLLIPFLIEMNENQEDLDDETMLMNYLKLNEVIELPILFDAYEVLQEKIGKYYLKLNDYQKAELYYKYALQIFEFQHNYAKIKITKKIIIRAIQKHYTELAIAANLFSNTSRKIEAEALAWSGLLNALRLIENVFEFEFSKKNSLEIILEYFDMCKRPLLKDDNDMREVVELKLNELNNFFISLKNDELDDETARMYLEMHADSLKFMVPTKAAQFMLMTSDGRLLYTREASMDSEQDTDTSYLLAGALTAIRSVLTEASMSQEGSVKEITLGDSVLLIEARKSVVVVASSLKIDDQLRAITTEMADHIEESWHEELWDWFGDRESITPMIEYVDELIEEKLIG